MCDYRLLFSEARPASCCCCTRAWWTCWVVISRSRTRSYFPLWPVEDDFRSLCVQTEILHLVQNDFKEKKKTITFFKYAKINEIAVRNGGWANVFEQEMLVGPSATKALCWVSIKNKETGNVWKKKTHDCRRGWTLIFADLLRTFKILPCAYTRVPVNIRVHLLIISTVNIFEKRWWL